jgi:hypothetical protein
VGPTERRDVSSSETRVYRGKPPNNFKLIGRLLVLILVIPLLVGVFILCKYMDTGSFNFTWYIRHMKPLLVPWAQMFLLCLFFVYLRIKNRNLKIEISPEGIAQIKSSGKKIFIPWKEMGKLTSGGGTFVTVKDKTGNLKLTVSPFYEDFEQIKKRVFEESEKNQGPPPRDGRVYAMAPSVGKAYLWASLLFVIFGFGALVCAVVSSLGLLPSRMSPLIYSIIMVVCVLIFLVPAVYCLWWGPKVSQSKIKVSEGGFRGWNGMEPVFLSVGKI